MEGADGPAQHHKKTLHSKRSFGKHPKHVDSPAYDASEEDNGPLTDDGASTVSIPVIRTSASASSQRLSVSHLKPSGKAKHQLAASLVSDDGVDSPTYDGDIESSTAPRLEALKLSYNPVHHHSSSSTSTLNTPSTHRPLGDAPTSDDRLSVHPELRQRVNTEATSPRPPGEPAPAAPSAAAFNPASLTMGEIQNFVKKAIEGEPSRAYKINKPPTDRAVRIYADGVYDLFHFGHSLQLRQAKLSFPTVYLLVGVNSDKLVREHKGKTVMSHAERCESVRHCRWVDEVVPEAPWVIDADFLGKWGIDYVAHDEEPYPAANHTDVYTYVKSQGKFLPTRRTPGISTSELLERVVSGYRHCDFDEKLSKMGHPELKASGSDFDDSRPHSRNTSPLPPKNNKAGGG